MTDTCFTRGLINGSFPKLYEVYDESRQGKVAWVL